MDKAVLQSYISTIITNERTRKSVASAADRLLRTTVTSDADDGDGAAIKGNLASNTRENVSQAKQAEQAAGIVGLEINQYYVSATGASMCKHTCWTLLQQLTGPVLHWSRAASTRAGDSEGSEGGNGEETSEHDDG